MSRTYLWLATLVLAVLVVQWAVAVLVPLIPELIAFGVTILAIPTLWTLRRWRSQRW